MALVKCRRFPGCVCGAPPRLAVIRLHVNQQLPGRTWEDWAPTARTSSTDTRTAAPLMLLKPLGHQALRGPSAHSAAQRAACWNVESCARPRGHSSLCHPAYRVGSIGSTSSSRRVLTTSSALLGLISSRAPASKASPLKPGSPGALKADEEGVEVFDSFEEPRVFLRLRPEYQLHSYNKAEPCQPLSVSESKLILHKVRVHGESLQPRTIADHLCRLSAVPAEQRPVLRSSASFALLCQLSVKNIQLLDVPELIRIMKAFVDLGIPHSHPLLDVYETRFCHKVWEMRVDQLLLVADLWRYLGRRAPRFLKIFFSYLNLHWKDLSLSQLIHLIYIIGESRQAPPDLMQKLESLILKYIDSISLEEAGAICLGFFKSSSSLSEFVMRKIGDLACADMQHLSSYALVNILKMFRFTHVDHVSFMKRFGQVAPQRIPALGVQGVMHLTLACSALRVLDEGVLNAVAASLPPRVAYCRSKDVAKFLWSFGTLNYKPPNAEELYSSLVSEIHRKMPEFNQHPEHLLTCLLGLAFAGHFPGELIDLALSPGFIRLAQERSQFELTKELYTLDGSVGVECPGYTGSRLSSHLQQEGAAMLWNSARKDMTSKPEFLEALFLLETVLGGPQYVKHHMVLPHTRSSDLEVQLDADMKPLPFNREATPTEGGAAFKLKHVGVSLTEDLMSQLLGGKSGGRGYGETESQTGQRPVEVERAGAAGPLGTSLHRVMGGAGATEVAAPGPPACVRAPHVKLAVQLTNRNQYCYGSRRLLGLHHMKRRQLGRLGYRVVELAPWEWLPLLPRTRLEKLAFLHEKVFSAAL
ncbi:FAST kinase domain-containing protein 5, mitochondrial [Saccopteryx leptura]|uniref:FAST kinase domain-containing protein 5, mitochondrial n=1 Tax=Saccopteryx leptura TaxID=249018 RepID=UPI00339BA038